MLELRIVSPERIEYDGQVLQDHAPIISTLQNGEVVYTTKEGRVSLSIQGGFVEVQKNVVSVCVEMA